MSNDDSIESHVVQLKSCPRCKTAIRRSLRYGDVIKQQLHDIEEVKKKVNGNSRGIEETKKRLTTRLADLEEAFNGDNEIEEWKRLSRRVERLSQLTLAAVTENQVNLMERYCVMSRKLKDNLFSENGLRKNNVEGKSIFTFQLIYRLIHKEIVNLYVTG